jgi:hypothetical protein
MKPIFQGTDHSGDGGFFLLGAEVGGGVSVKAEILKSETLKWRGRMMSRFSIQPFFKPQAGDMGEVHGVAGEERGIVD